MSPRPLPAPLPHVVVRDVDIVSGATAHDHAMALRSTLERAIKDTAAEARAEADFGAAAWLDRLAARLAPPR